MRDMSEHCPFLNRSDPRCSEYFRLSHLQHAFKFCFDQYQTCPVYGEQLAERQGRRAAAAGAVTHASTSRSNPASVDGHDGNRRPQVVVTVTIPARYAQPQRAA